jgi:hypothetical protein
MNGEYLRISAENSVAFFKLLLWNLPRETEKYHEEESVT